MSAVLGLGGVVPLIGTEALAGLGVHVLAQLAVMAAASVLLVTLFIPLSASALGVLFLNEPFSWRLGAGIAIVTAAALLINETLHIGRRQP